MSKIEWTHILGPGTGVTWNPVTGCTPVNEGCENCYAKRMAETRIRWRCGYDAEEPFKITYHEGQGGKLASLRNPRGVLVCSMIDLFHNDIATEHELFWIDAYNQHTYFMLTKRAENMRDLLHGRNPRYNWWLGVTVENQRRAEERLPILMELASEGWNTFVSVEPQLGPVSLLNYMYPSMSMGIIKTDALKWVIAGGETGPGTRPANPDWFLSLRDQCASAGIPFFFKGNGGRVKNRLLDGQEHNEFPEVNR
jgi:protein gp37